MTARCREGYGQCWLQHANNRSDASNGTPIAHTGPMKIPKVTLGGGASPPTCANVMRAGDGNRTRTISLGS